MSVSIRHSIVQGGQPDGVDDWLHSSADDPLFEAPDNLQLLKTSPAVDTGDSELADLPETDLAGNPRIADGNGDGHAFIDRGAFERQP
jgi:hypothetical protein